MQSSLKFDGVTNSLPKQGRRVFQRPLTTQRVCDDNFSFIDRTDLPVDRPRCYAIYISITYLNECCCYCWQTLHTKKIANKADRNNVFSDFVVETHF